MKKRERETKTVNVLSYFRQQANPVDIYLINSSKQEQTEEKPTTGCPKFAQFEKQIIISYLDDKAKNMTDGAPPPVRRTVF